MTGYFLGLLSGLCFAMTNICTRRGVVRVKDASLGGYISVFVGPPLFLMVALFAGSLHDITTFTWQGYVLMALAGIIHFVIGRSFNYLTVSHLGANISSILMSTSLVYTVLLGFFVLGETVTWHTIAGALLIILGPALIILSSRGKSLPKPGKKSHRLPGKGIITGLIGAICFGSTGLIIKWGLSQGGSSLAGAFISFSGASLALGMTMFNSQRKEAVIHLEHRAQWWFLFSGIFSALAQLSRYTAMSMAPISIVGPLTQTSPLFLLILSLMINRKIESFRFVVILGAVLVVIGAALLYI